MAVTVTVDEAFTGHRANDLISGQGGILLGTFDVPFKVQGTSDAMEAWAQILAQAPQMMGTFVLHSVYQLEPIDIVQGRWDALVRYQNPTYQPTDNVRMSFSTGGGTQHIVKSKETVASYGVDDDEPPDFGGLIGVSENDVAGVDIDASVYEFQLDVTFPISLITTDYENAVASLTDTTNESEFRGFDVGEVRFRYAEGSSAPGNIFNARFYFARSKNLTNISVGDMSGIEKNGWDYLWVFYAPKSLGDEAGSTIVAPYPRYAYVERLFDSGDFDLLQLDQGIIIATN